MLKAINDLAERFEERFDALKQDVDMLKRHDREQSSQSSLSRSPYHGATSLREQSSQPSRSRLRSPRCASSPSRHSFMSQGTPQSRVSSADHCTWADRVEEEENDCLHHDSDEEIDGTWGGPDLVELSKETQTPDCSLHAKREQ